MKTISVFCIVWLTVFCNILSWSQSTNSVINDLNKKYDLRFYIQELAQNDNYIPLHTDTALLNEYEGRKLPDREHDSGTVFVFRSFFNIDKTLHNNEFALHIGLLNYPCRIFCNGVQVVTLGNYKEAYTSRVRFSSSIMFPSNCLRTDSLNEITIQTYQRYGESSSLGRVFIASKKQSDVYTFIRNFISFNLVQATLIVSFILWLYFLFLHILKKDKSDRKYLIFSWFCFSFGLSYINIALSNNYINELFVYQIARVTAALASLLFVYFTISITQVLKPRLWIIAFFALPSLVFAVLFATQSNLAGIELYFKKFGTFVNLPYIVFSFVLATVAMIRTRSRLHITFFIGFIVLFVAIFTDTINYSRNIMPYTWVIPHGFFFFIMTVFFMLSAEQTHAFNLSIERGVLLQNMKDSLEDTVKQRTAKIEQQNEELRTQAEHLNETNNQLKELNTEIGQQKEEIQAQAEFLLEANTEITRQKNLLQYTHDKITDSINYARRIQQALLPPTEHFKHVFADAFVLFKPREIVSGDFYFLKKIDNLVVIAVADCTGHGVPGAFMSMLGVTLMSEIVRHQQNLQANNILNLLRDQIKASLQQTGKTGEQQDGMDMSLCIYNTDTRELQFAGAHNSLLIIRQHTTPLATDILKHYTTMQNDTHVLYEIKADQQPIGVFRKERPFTNKQLQLSSNDVLYLFSDGFADQRGGKQGSKFMKRMFKTMLLNMVQIPISDQKQHIENVFVQWRGNYDQVDDVLVMGVKI